MESQVWGNIEAGMYFLLPLLEAWQESSQTARAGLGPNLQSEHRKGFSG